MTVWARAAVSAVGWAGVRSVVLQASWGAVTYPSRGCWPRTCRALRRRQLHSLCFTSIEAACWAVRSELALQPVFLSPTWVVALTGITPCL